VVPLIWWLGTPAAIAASCAGFALAAVCYAEPGPQRLRHGLFAAGAGALALGVATTASFPAAPTKLVSRFLADPGWRSLHTRWTPIGRVDVVGHEPPIAIGGYASWGLSPHYAGKSPPFVMIGNDGDSCAVMYGWDGELASLDFLSHHVLAAPPARSCWP
jgi:hypothetical protein